MSGHLNFRAIFHRKTGARTKNTEWTRPYKSRKNAIRRAMDILLDIGQPGDTVEIIHVGTEKQVATVTVRVGGHFDTWRLEDERYDAANLSEKALKEIKSVEEEYAKEQKTQNKKTKHSKTLGTVPAVSHHVH